MKIQCKDIPDREVLSLIFWYSNNDYSPELKGFKNPYNGPGWQMIELGVPEKIAYMKLEKQPGIMFGTGLMTCWFEDDYNLNTGTSTKDEGYLKLMRLGGPLPLEVARANIKKCMELLKGDEE